jgi:2-keto-4-pentenoate hydratase
MNHMRGIISSGIIHHSPATLDSAAYFRLGVECEIAVQLGSELLASKAPYTRETVSNAVETVMPAC